MINEALVLDAQHPYVQLVHCGYLISSGRLDEAREVYTGVEDTGEPMAVKLLKDPSFQKLIATLDAVDPKS